MKIKAITQVFLTAFLTVSCSTTSYYQLYKTRPVSQIKTDDRGLVYEDDNCMVTYDFWSENGNAGFIYYNKTDENIYINLSDSYFIVNGVAYDYFKNRVTEQSSNRMISQNSKTTLNGFLPSNNPFSYLVGISIENGVSSLAGNSISFTEQKIISVPSKTSKVITEYYINEFLVGSCDLLKYPSKKQVKPVIFNEDSSPITFSNRVAYNVGTGNTIKFENSFYVSEISNHPFNEFTSIKHDKRCGEKATQKVYNYEGADKFYIRYKKGTDTSKH